ncbi:hypothetical protein AVEN_53906-1 [Araneus ventricosus]|uniref:Uncharacterized protein n=1 Tax=Araneus ventricosus TaxID=182803 RepID=A0A4Y2IFA4_ARAVE|nr:hypothetical protein AVEN_53906-1 [Araneus ventricosus]
MFQTYVRLVTHHAKTDCQCQRPVKIVVVWGGRFDIQRVPVSIIAFGLPGHQSGRSWSIKPSSRGPSFCDPCPCYTLSPIEGPQRMGVARVFVGWRECSVEMSVNARTLKEASRQMETSVQCLRAVVDCVCGVGTVCLVESRPVINS